MAQFSDDVLHHVDTLVPCLSHVSILLSKKSDPSEVGQFLFVMAHLSADMLHRLDALAIFCNRLSSV